MFKWLVKKATKAVHEAQGEIEAEKKGLEAGRHFIASVEAYAEPRFEQVRTDFMKAHKSNLDTAVVDPDISPIVVARVYCDVYIKQVEKMRLHLIGEIQTRFKGWIETWAQAGLEAETKALIEKKVNDFSESLANDGLEEAARRFDQLREADTKWRAANPEKAAHYPPAKGL